MPNTARQQFWTCLCVALAVLAFGFSCAKKEDKKKSNSSSAPPAETDGGGEGTDTAGTTTGGGDEGGATTGGDDSSTIQAGVLNINSYPIDTDATSSLLADSSLPGLPPENLRHLPPGTIGISLQSGTPFDADQATVMTTEPSLDAVNQGHALLCMLAQTKYINEVGQGPYLAYVDAKACKDLKQDEGVGTSAPSNTGAPFVVDVTRADRNSPLIAKFWAALSTDQSISFQSMYLRGTLTVAKGANQANPYGVMRVSWIGLGYNDTTGRIIPGELRSKGIIDTGELEDNSGVVVRYTSFEPGSAIAPDAALGAGSVRSLSAQFRYDSAAGTLVEGQAFTGDEYVDPDFPATPPPDGQFRYARLAFNADYALIRDAFSNDNRCVQRSAPPKFVTQYGVYNNADGNRFDDSSFKVYLVGQESGEDYFGVYTIRDGLEFYGWEPNDGRTVYRPDPANPTALGTAYTILRSPGTLYRSDKTTVTNSADLDGQIFQDSASEFLVQWNETAGRFDKVGEKRPGTGIPSGPVLQWDFIAPQAYTGPANATENFLPYGLFDRNYEYLNVDYDGTGQPNFAGNGVWYRKRTVVTPTQAANLDLVCKYGCLKGDIQEADVNALNHWYTDGTNRSYQYDATNRVLVDQTGMADVVPAYTGGQGLFAMNLVLAANVGEIDSFNSSDNPYYTWHTGFSDGLGGRYVGLIDGSSNPLLIEEQQLRAYKHVAANDFDERGSSSYFDFSIDILFESSRQEFTQIPLDVNGWPAFGIKAGTVIGPFKVRPLEVIERLDAADLLECSGLTLGTEPNFIGLDGLEDPANATANQPAVRAVKYINGRAVE